MIKEIKFNQDESNLIYFCKRWYECDSFWDSIGDIYCTQYGYDGIYSMIRKIWLKILFASSEDEQKHILANYDKYSTMMHSGNVWGGIANGIFPSKDTNFNYYQLTQARIAAMVSEIAHTEAKWLKCLNATDIGDVKLKKK